MCATNVATNDFDELDGYLFVRLGTMKGYCGVKAKVDNANLKKYIESILRYIDNSSFLCPRWTLTVTADNFQCSEKKAKLSASIGTYIASYFFMSFFLIVDRTEVGLDVSAVGEYVLDLDDDDDYIGTQ